VPGRERLTHHAAPQLHIRRGRAGRVTATAAVVSRWEQVRGKYGAVASPQDLPTAAAFARRYKRGRQPLLGSLAEIGARPPGWAWSSLRDDVEPTLWLSIAVSGASDPPAAVRMRAHNYTCDYCEVAGEAEPLYLFADPPHSLWDAVISSLPPGYFTDDLLDALGSGMGCAGKYDRHITGRGGRTASAAVISPPPSGLMDERRWVVAGPAGAGARWHVDPHGTAAWHVLLEVRPDIPPMFSGSLDDDRMSSLRGAFPNPDVVIHRGASSGLSGPPRAASPPAWRRCLPCQGPAES
jgi:hypothetical protein